MRPSRLLAGLMVIAGVASAGCGGVSGKAAEEQRRTEHPCQFSATSEQCLREVATEKKQEEARHETGALRERARVEAERARLKRELGQ
jgi:hypothetical protein